MYRQSLSSHNFIAVTALHQTQYILIEDSGGDEGICAPLVGFGELQKYDVTHVMM